MDDNTVGMVLGLAFFLCASGVFLLRPIVKKLAIFLEAAAEQRRRAVTGGEGLAQVQKRLGSIEARLASLETESAESRQLGDHVRFLEQLVAERQGSTALPRGEG